VDINPTDWLTFYFDSKYDLVNEHLSTANFDIYINGKDDKWKLGIGKRYNRSADDQLTLDYEIKINPKWAFGFYERFDLEGGELKETEYRLMRDLHAWQWDLMFSDTKGEGEEILMSFTLKAYPEMGIDFGKSFDKMIII